MDIAADENVCVGTAEEDAGERLEVSELGETEEAAARLLELKADEKTEEVSNDVCEEKAARLEEASLDVRADEAWAEETPELLGELELELGRSLEVRDDEACADDSTLLGYVDDAEAEAERVDDTVLTSLDT